MLSCPGVRPLTLPEQPHPGAVPFFQPPGTRLPGSGVRRQAIGWCGLALSALKGGCPMEHPAGAGIEPADTIPAILPDFHRHGFRGAVSRHIRLDPSSLGKLWVNPRELTARDFSLAESSESGGILCVFPAFGTARIGEKSRCSAEGDLFRDSLKERAAHFGAGEAGRIQTGIHWGVQPLLCHLSYRLMCPHPAFAGRDLPLSCPASPVSPGSSKPRSWVVSCIRP